MKSSPVAQAARPACRLTVCATLSANRPQTEAFADIQHQVWSGCRDGTAVELYTIVGGKHAWPGSAGPAWRGGDEPTQTLSASRLIWEFFAAHPKP